MTSPRDVEATLRERILGLEYAPGTPLREIALSEELGCSRRTAREALLALGRAGLVSHERNRGASVRAFIAADVRDLYLVRRTLEVAGAEQCREAPPELLTAVSEAYDALDAAAREEQDSVAHALADMRFHGAVIGLLGSARLSEVFRHIGDEMAYAIRLLHRNEVTGRIDVDRVLAEHRGIRDAVLGRDPEAASLAVRTHISDNEAALLRLADS